MLNRCKKMYNFIKKNYFSLINKNIQRWLGQERPPLTKLGAPQPFEKELQRKKTIIDTDFISCSKVFIVIYIKKDLIEFLCKMNHYLHEHACIQVTENLLVTIQNSHESQPMETKQNTQLNRNVN